MANCCLCNAEFCKRKNLKGYEKRLLSSVLPHKNVTLYEVLQMVCNKAFPHQKRKGNTVPPRSPQFDHWVSQKTPVLPVNQKSGWSPRGSTPQYLEI